MPLYDTLGPDAVQYIISHAHVTLVCCDALKLPALVEPVKAAKGQVSAVVYWGEVHTLAKMVRPGTGPVCTVACCWKQACSVLTGNAWHQVCSRFTGC